ncbi:copper amine oxidase [Thermoascus aurantiacus ATCC 26904]
MRFTSLLLAAIVAAGFNAFARPQPKAPWVTKPGRLPGNKGHIRRGYANVSSSCDVNDRISIKAPRKNIFLGLDDSEAAAVTSFLHRQPALNLTAVENATSWDNVILLVELLQPNKSDALPYLNGVAAAPDRYAKATIQFQATEEPYIQEWMVGPLPISNKTTLQPLNYLYNKGVGIQRVYDADSDALEEFLNEIGASVADITLELWNGTIMGAENDTLSIWGIDPLWHENGTVILWNEFWNTASEFYDSSTLLPLGLYVKTNITGRDPAGWSVMGWYYNGIFYESTEAFREAFFSSSFEKLGPNVDGDWAHTDQQGEIMQYDEISPPMLVLPGKPRYGIDMEEKYVEWMDFSFFISFSRDTGMKLFDIRYKGERIIYELGLQEAMAHYAGSDPVQSGTAYLDSYYGFGPYAFELVGGYDCPSYATYLNTSFYVDETTHTHVNSLCLFEADLGYPVQRHSTGSYVSVTKNIMLVLRSVSTVGNYDYMFEYSFHLDGSIQVTVRASGYIQSAYWAHNGDYGFKIHDNLSGSMHDHVLNYKLDIDINGTANTLMKTAIVPVSEEYPWSAGQKRNTMKLERSFITNENMSKLMWPENNGAMYTVVNKDAKNKYGEYRGYRIVPSSGNMIHLTVQNSTNLKDSANWASHHFFVTKQKDTEMRNAYPYNSLDPEFPVIDFNKFFDGESLEQEDIVIHFNLGMHHVPDTSDLPNTVFTTAQSSLTILPQNYLLSDPSQQTVQQVRINYANGTVQKVETFGSLQPTCELDLRTMTTNLSAYVGDVVVRKFPYEPLSPYFETDSIS